jgi:hypothetical protein
MALALSLVTRHLLEPNQKTATDAVALQLTCAFELAPRTRWRRNGFSILRFAAVCLRIGGEQAKSFATRKNLLLHICDLYDAPLCLRVLRVLDHGHVQLLIVFTECYVCRAITRRDLKYV